MKGYSNDYINHTAQQDGSTTMNGINANIKKRQMKGPVDLRLNMTANSQVTGMWLVAAQFKTHRYNWYSVSFITDVFLVACFIWQRHHQASKSLRKKSINCPSSYCN